MSRTIRWITAIVACLGVAYTFAWLTWRYGLPLVHTKPDSGDRLALAVGIMTILGAAVILPLASWAARPLQAEADRQIVNDLFTYLESRRALWVPFDSENLGYVVRSVLAMREELSEMQRKLRPQSPVNRSIRTLRLTCERFLTNIPKNELWFYSNLGELRGVFGSELGHLAGKFNLNVEKPLAWIIPPVDENKVSEFVPDGTIWIEGYIPPPDNSRPPPPYDSMPDEQTSTEQPEQPPE